MEMLLQKYLLGGGTPAKLEEELAVTHKPHRLYPQLLLFKYNQIESPMANPLVRECRGVILDSSDNWRVIARPFDKFFNYGEGHAATIDWKTAKVQEKLDGSLCTMYFYNGTWYVATSGTPDASGAVHDLQDRTFRDLFWIAFHDEMGNDLPPHSMVDMTFMFELMSPHNRVVVPHAETNLVLIGVRDRFTGEEKDVDEYGKKLNWATVRSFPLQSMDQVVETFDELDPLRQEGYVIVDAKFNRNKVKHPGYVAIHHLKGEQGPTPKRMLEIARTGEGGEILAHFPEWKPMYEDVRTQFDALVNELEEDFSRITSNVAAAVPAGVTVSPSWLQKEFAAYAVKTRCSDALFKMRSGKIPSIRRYLADMDVGKLASVLKLSEEDSGTNHVNTPGSNHNPVTTHSTPTA